MPSTASARLRLEKMATGEKINTWGTTQNAAQFDLLDEAVAGVETIALTGNHTLTSTNYVSDEARNMGLRFTGSLGSGATITIPTVEKLYFVINDSGQTLTFSAGGTTGVVENGRRKWVGCDATDVYVGEDGADKEYVDAADALKLDKAGGTMTGALILNAAPTVDLHASTKKYVDDTAFASLSGVLPGQGGNSGKYLGTNGTNASWNAFPTTLAGYGITDPLLPYTKLSGDITGVINNQYAADSTTAARTVTLPAHVENGVVILSDEDGNASVNNAVLSDGTDTWTIDLNYGWIALVSKSGAWKVKARG
jgi:hypothetical protein